MRVSVEPLSAVPPRLVKEHLRTHGVAPEIIEWKYFDSQFNAARERGFAWVKNDRVQGMIGLVPFRLGWPQGDVTLAWTCDWFVEAAASNPGVGVLILRKALAASGLLMTVGGNEATHRIVPRLAAQTVPNAGVEMVLPLTVGGTQTYERLERRVPLGPLAQLGRVPLPGTRRRSSWPGATVTEPGVTPLLEGLLSAAPETAQPQYDFSYVQWQLGRCPAIECASTYASGLPSQDSAVAAWWRPKTGGHRWRLALWMNQDHQHVGRAVLDAALAQMLRKGAQSVSAVVCRSDQAGMALLRAAGFRPIGREFPLYVLSSGEATPPPVVTRMSYLDSDLAYRF